MTPLNHTVWGEPQHITNIKGAEVNESLGNWLQLIKSLAARPTSVHKIVPQTVDFYGYCNTCNMGDGWAWLLMDSDLHPFIWRVLWPTNVVKKLQSYDGMLINNAECAEVLLQ